MVARFSRVVGAMGRLVRAATTAEHRGAILAFNLLGMQATTGVVNWGWVERVLTDFTGANASPEARLFQTRYGVLTGKLSLAEAARSYTAIAGDTASTRPFAWTGVKDQARIDSFFDPFGNLDVRQRAQVELARTLFAQRKDARAQQSLDTLAATLSPRKALQLRGYTPLLKPAAPAAKTP